MPSTETPKSPRLSITVRKLIGTVVILAWILFYMTTVAALWEWLPEMGQILTLLYFVIAGFLWVFPLKPLIAWMQIPDQPKATD